MAFLLPVNGKAELQKVPMKSFATFPAEPAQQFHSV